MQIRVRFSKQGPAAYISHLDLNRFMARAVRRSGVPVWYTQGFNPHPYITFALPLSIFYESDCEAMDLRLDAELAPERVRERLNAQMPEGIAVTEVYEPLMKQTDTAFARYDIAFDFEGMRRAEIETALGRLLALDSAVIEKATKHGVRKIDVLACFKEASVEAGDGSLRLRAVLPASPQENLNPSCFSAALRQYASLEPDFEQVRRTGIFNEKMEPFR